MIWILWSFSTHVFASSPAVQMLLTTVESVVCSDETFNGRCHPMWSRAWERTQTTRSTSNGAADIAMSRLIALPRVLRVTLTAEKARPCDSSVHRVFVSRRVWTVRCLFLEPGD